MTPRVLSRRTWRFATLFLAAVAAMLVMVAVACASAPLGPGDTLYSDYPVHGSGIVYGDGSVQGDYVGNHLAIDVCLQVQTPTGGWVDKSGSCLSVYPANTYEEVYSQPESYTAGHTYRTWDQATIPGYSATSASRGWTAP